MAELKKDQKPKKTRSNRLMPDQVPEYRRTERRVLILAPFVRIIQDWVHHRIFPASYIFKRLIQVGYTGGYCDQFDAHRAGGRGNAGRFYEELAEMFGVSKASIEKMQGRCVGRIRFFVQKNK